MGDGDECTTHKIDGFTVQENGIVRGPNGAIVGRLSELLTNDSKIEIDGRAFKVPTDVAELLRDVSVERDKLLSQKIGRG